MAAPTTSDFLNQTTPAAPAGDQNIVFQTDGSIPEQSISAYARTATASLRGVVKPDGTSITVASDGTIAVVPSVQTGAVGITVDGGGSVPTTGVKGFVQVPYNATVTGWTLLADQSGSAVVTVKKSTYAGFPTTASIVASAPPTLTSAQGATSTTLTGWTTTITAGDVLEFDLTSVTTCQRLTLLLKLTRT